MGLEWAESVPGEPDIILGSDGNYYHWPMCATPGCKNRACLGKSDRFCFPCSGSGTSFDDLMRRIGARQTERASFQTGAQ